MRLSLQCHHFLSHLFSVLFIHWAQQHHTSHHTFIIMTILPSLQLTYQSFILLIWCFKMLGSQFRCIYVLLHTIRIYLQKYLGFKLIAFIGMLGVVVCVFVTSFFKSLFGYIFFYGLLYGMSAGICYMVPMLNSYIYLPKKKGLCSGLYMMAFGLGAVLFNNIFLKLINPNNQPATNHIFPKDVADNVPSALRTISLIYTGIGMVGCILLIPKSTLKIDIQGDSTQQNQEINQNSNKIEKQSVITNQQNNQRKPSDDIEEVKTVVKTSQKQVQPLTDFMQLLKTPQYKQLFLMIITMMPFGAFIIMNYKQYGQTLTDNDSLLTVISSSGSITNSISRIFWCWLLDKYSFRSIHLILNTSMIIYMIFTLFVKNEYVYIVLINLIYFSYGANYGTFPTITVQIYGDKDGSRLYSFVFIAFSSAAIIQFLFHYFIVKNMGDKGFFICFLIFGSLLFIAEILLFKIDFKQKQNKKKKDQLNQEN